MPNGGIGGEFKLDNTTTTTISDLIQNPSTYYGTNRNTPITSAGPANLTQDWWNPTIKTLYDPCPNGYRIPNNGTYGNIYSETPSEIGWDWSGSTLTSGYTWTNTFFPASGYRYASNGKFTAVGTYGYGWMSTPQSPISGHSLLFISGYVYPNHYYYRSDGFPARCIKD